MYAEEYAVILVSAAIGNPLMLMVFDVNFSSVNRVNEMQLMGSIVYTDLSFVFSIIVIVLHNRKNRSYNKNIRQLTIMCLLIMAHFGFMCLSMADKKTNLNYITVSMHSVFQGIIIVLSIAQFYSIKRGNQFLLADEELKRLRLEMQHTYDYYMLANEKYDDISKLRHDINNQINTVKMLIADGVDKAEAEKIIEQLQSRLSEIRAVEFCGNPIINAVLTAKSHEAGAGGIETDFLLRGCENLPFDNYDICSLFANLCDNAIEACKKFENSKHRFIEIRSGIKENYFILKVRNSSVKSEIKYVNRLFRTSKKNEAGHGYGLKIINSIVKKYNGEIKINSGDGEFTVIVTLKLK